MQRKLIREKHILTETLQKLKETTEALRITNITKDTLFSIIAHDLLNPLSNILGFAKLLHTRINENNVEKILNLPIIFTKALNKFLIYLKIYLVGHDYKWASFLLI